MTRGYGRDVAREILKNIREFGGKLTTVESCTAGRVAAALCAHPGSSSFFDSGLIVYSNEAKTSLLDVPDELIKRHGAVSEEVAIQMAIKAKALRAVDFSLAVTGIAGPDSDESGAPVGLVYIAAAYPSEVLNEGYVCGEFNFNGTREEILIQAVQECLIFLLDVILVTRRALNR